MTSGSESICSRGSWAMLWMLISKKNPRNAFNDSQDIQEKVGCRFKSVLYGVSNNEKWAMIASTLGSSEIEMSHFYVHIQSYLNVTEIACYMVNLPVMFRCLWATNLMQRFAILRGILTINFPGRIPGKKYCWILLAVRAALGNQ